MWTEGSGKGKPRFSYLLLEEGDHYIQDWIATCRPRLAGGSQRIRLPPWQQRRLKGRLRLCGRCIFFDPDLISAPILMFPFNKVKKLQKLEEPDGAGGSKVKRKEAGFVLDTELTVKMKENGLDLPYEFDKEEAAWWFCLEYAPVEQFLQRAQSLMSINALSNSERAMILQNAAAQREAKAQFDISRLEDLNETIFLDFPSAQVSPLVREPGRLVLSSSRLYFQALHNLNDSSPVRSQSLTSIVAVARRRHALRHIGVEVFFKDTTSSSRSLFVHGQSYCASTFFTFQSVEERNIFINKLLEQLRGQTKLADMIGSFLSADSHWLTRMTAVWQEALISNYEYLLYLNLVAGRSFCDLTQWPVMPWILMDYESNVLDLTNPSIFRDLSKPIGALNPSRLAVFQERYAQMSHDDPLNPPFLYGTHYSTPGYVLYWLVRSAPGYMLRLQNGRFDSPDRLFVSLSESWESVMTNTTDLKELIPEFYSFPSDFLVMREGLNLGIRQSGTRIADVILPPWAKDPDDFILKHREALDCIYTSVHLHEWIDLIFGSKQQGQAALQSNNLFHPITYEGSIDLEKIEDPFKQMGLEAQIHEFGQAPMQLFDFPHPRQLPRKRVELQSEDLPEDNRKKNLYGYSSADYLPQLMAIASSFSSKASCHPSKEIGNTCMCDSVKGLSEDVVCAPIAHDIEGGDPYQKLSVGEVPKTEVQAIHLRHVIKGKNVLEGDKTIHELHKREVAEQFRDAEVMKAVGLEPESKLGDTFSWHWMFRQRLSDPVVLKLHRGPVNAVLLSDENASDSPTIYSAGQDGYVKVYSISDGLQMRSTKLGVLPLSCLALLDSNDAYPIVLAGSYDNSLYAYSVDYGRAMGKILAHDGTISGVCVIPNGVRIATASWDASVKLWSMESCKNAWLSTSGTGDWKDHPIAVPVMEFSEHDAAILSLDVEDTGRLLISGAADGSVIAWDIRTPAAAAAWHTKLSDGSAADLRIISDASQVVVASGQGFIHILETRMSGSLISSKDCGDPLRCCELAGQLVIAGSSDGRMHFWPTSFSSEGVSEVNYLDYSPIHDHRQAINSMSLIGLKSGAATLASASEDSCIHIYSVGSLQQLRD